MAKRQKILSLISNAVADWESLTYSFEEIMENIKEMKSMTASAIVAGLTEFIENKKYSSDQKLRALYIISKGIEQRNEIFVQSLASNHNLINKITLDCLEEMHTEIPKRGAKYFGKGLTEQSKIRGLNYMLLLQEMIVYLKKNYGLATFTGIIQQLKEEGPLPEGYHVMTVPFDPYKNFCDTLFVPENVLEDSQDHPHNQRDSGRKLTPNF
eukprot:CAMPEP_0114575380 /NCGR_PEP_ID=MMETSP0125-20121206/255_1 /TAXON_ID=485358 ORGANISM="Aristerostoma sp., Strain ATCC 50986" /NCGR_SAMPLE_ID=MMETSP0125 /ASSEMBLY_ACC=CAM_ASM_000245 /LENGTH=210 /DNA_ID=CAMNT_0001763063 /DNA_START=12 /DNA_END=644 /DNA_ORIENTATION=+